MKVLIATRLYTGLQDCVRRETWVPRGVPAIYKLIESLDRQDDIDLDVAFSALRARDSASLSLPKCMVLPPLGAQFHILPFRAPGVAPRLLDRIANIAVGRLLPINPVHQISALLQLVRRNRYDVIYCDKVHVGFGAICAGLLRRRVVLRVLGVYSGMHRLADARTTPFNSALKRFYRAPFRHIICTQDGSGGEIFLSKMINADTPRDTLLNGVDLVPTPVSCIRALRTKYRLREHRPVVLFVGKLERQKGCLEFVESLIALSGRTRNFYGLLVGDGPLREQLQDAVSEAGLSRQIFFAGLVDHNVVSHYLSLADVYVSLNREGNLSNTVLEALAYGKCIVRLRSSREEYRDVYTDQILPEQLAPVVTRKREVVELPARLAELISNPGLIHEYSRKARQVARERLSTWKQRIEWEVNLLRRVGSDDSDIV